MGSTFASSWASLPPFREFLLPTPQTYTTLVNIFQYFPVFTLIQWAISWHPAGKGSYQSSLLNVPGRLGWFIMEAIGPVNLLYTLWKLPPLLGFNLASLPPANKLVAALYVIHYINRAVVSPLVAAPSMSPMHLFVVSMAVLFNWFNSACLAGWLVGYHIPVLGYTTDGSGDGAGDGALSSPTTTTAYSPATHFLSSLGMVLFAAGMIGNIYSERTLFRLRREAASKRHDEQQQQQQQQQQHQPQPSSTPTTTTSKNKFSKVYVIPPPTGVFRSILYPHYVFEWLEWLGFALVGTAVLPNPALQASVSVSASASATASSYQYQHTAPLPLAPWLVPAAWLAEKLRVPLPLPAVVFVVNAVANMLPHARWGRKWYVERFGEGAVAGRGAAVPWCAWL